MTGILGRKKGMGALYHKGRHTAVTVLEVGPCPVIDVKSREKHGYDALQIAFEPLRSKLVSKPRAGQFKRAGVEPHRIVREIRGATGDLETGATLTVEMFKVGDRVAVTGNSKGRGFAGVIKRHNFGRPNQSHGTHESFRGSGSIGQHSYPARVWPGIKMAGRMGGKRVTVKNLEVVGVDAQKGFLLLKGAVPGANGGLVMVKKTG